MIVELHKSVKGDMYSTMLEGCNYLDVLYD
jgi:hypothetical protein